MTTVVVFFLEGFGDAEWIWQLDRFAWAVRC
jgi:hypothetical protein